MFIYILGFSLEWAIQLSDVKAVESGARRAKVPLLNGIKGTLAPYASHKIFSEFSLVFSITIVAQSHTSLNPCDLHTPFISSLLHKLLVIVGRDFDYFHSS